jgi:hypothetical protein
LTPEAQKHNDIIDAEKNRIAMENYNAIKKAVADRKNNASSELASFNHPNDMARSMFMQGFMNSQLGRLPKEANVDLLQSQGMSFAEIEKLYPQLVTPQERKNQLEIIINDKGGKVEGVKLDGRPYALESPVYTSSTTGVKD